MHLYFFATVFLLSIITTVPGQDKPSDALPLTSAELDRVILHEMKARKLPSFSIAVARDRDIVWSKTYGLADPARNIPADSDTLYRVGSISKLFNAVAVMQLVEKGVLDLDAPLGTYLPACEVASAGPEPVTLRQILCHRSGLARESPIGSYFDPSEPGLAATCRSFGETEPVYLPGTRTKYSNAAVSLAGYVVEKKSGVSFARHLEKAVLKPLAMDSSSFERSTDVGAKVAKAVMWCHDGRRVEAPGFELGTIPAGNLYSTMDDLCRFALALFNGGQGPGGRILKPATIQSMWQPQVARNNRFGIGFALFGLDGHRAVGHGGAVYGFASQLTMIPDQKLVVAASTTLDVANAVVSRITTHALRCAMREREGKPLPSLALTRPVKRAVATRAAGRYGAYGSIELQEIGGRLHLLEASTLAEIRRDDQGLIVDDVHRRGTRVELGDNWVVLLKGTTKTIFNRIKVERPPPPPPAWNELIGEYGWDHNVLFIREVDGNLHAMTEWFFDYPLAPRKKDVFAFPSLGLYDGEQVTFERNDKGAVVAAVMAGIRFPRRDVGTLAGETFRIKPVMDIKTIRRGALASSPPPEKGDFLSPDLVDITKIVPGLRMDIRYAGKNNFMGEIFYPQALAFMQRPAAVALGRVQEKLATMGYGLLIHDAYRPWYVTKMFWDATPTSMKDFVADPSQGSRHNRGCAVDLTLFELKTGKPVQMVGGYDEFTERSYPAYWGGTSRQRWYRGVLRNAMESEGFRVYKFEWWHYDFNGWKRYPILNKTFDEIVPN